MAENSKIEWCTHTMNFWIGCQEVSLACKNCYAKVQNAHWQWVDGWGPHGERRRTSVGNWHKVRKWNRESGESGVRAKVFSNSLSDFFDNKADYTWRREAWHCIEQSPNLDFLLLTKRPQNIAKMLPDPETGVKPWGDGWSNVWLGATVEDRAASDRIGYLRDIPAEVRFLSCEPLLEAIEPNLDGISWVICGGESGPNARPMHPHWALRLRDQCVERGVPFFFKQWGEWLPWLQFNEAPGVVDEDCEQSRFPAVIWDDDNQAFVDHGGSWMDETGAEDADELDQVMGRVGKKAAGALLDGREWRQFPGPRNAP